MVLLSGSPSKRHEENYSPMHICCRPLVVRAASSPTEHLQRFLDGFYSAAEQEGLEFVVPPSGWLWRTAGSVFGRLGLPRTPRWVSRNAICPIAWASDRDAFPLQLRYRITPWIYDCWPADFARWDGLLSRLAPQAAYFSARSVARRFAVAHPSIRCDWVPEAIDPEAYEPGLALESRRTGLLELGRIWPAFSGRFRRGLEAAGVVYKQTFAGDRSRYVSACELPSVLADTRLLVCYPKSVSHPSVAGGVETVTYRYFEGMASRCVLIGHCPEELADLWGYNPVVEVGLDYPVEFLVDAALNPSRYQPLVDRNYDRLQEIGHWRHRIRLISCPGHTRLSTEL